MNLERLNAIFQKTAVVQHKKQRLKFNLEHIKPRNDLRQGDLNDIEYTRWLFLFKAWAAEHLYEIEHDKKDRSIIGSISTHFEQYPTEHAQLKLEIATPDRFKELLSDDRDNTHGCIGNYIERANKYQVRLEFHSLNIKRGIDTESSVAALERHHKARLAFKRSTPDLRYYYENFTDPESEPEIKTTITNKPVEFKDLSTIWVMTAVSKVLSREFKLRFGVLKVEQSVSKRNDKKSIMDGSSNLLKNNHILFSNGKYFLLKNNKWEDFYDCNIFFGKVSKIGSERFVVHYPTPKKSKKDLTREFNGPSSLSNAWIFLQNTRDEYFSNNLIKQWHICEHEVKEAPNRSVKRQKLLR